jgi:hypothetical protein
VITRKIHPKPENFGEKSCGNLGKHLIRDRTTNRIPLPTNTFGGSKHARNVRITIIGTSKVPVLPTNTAAWLARQVALARQVPLAKLARSLRKLMPMTGLNVN